MTDGHQWWGTNETPELAELINVFRHDLFTDDPMLQLAPDQMAFAVLDNGDRVIALINKVRADYFAEETT